MKKYWRIEMNNLSDFLHELNYDICNFMVKNDCNRESVVIFIDYEVWNEIYNLCSHDELKSIDFIYEHINKKLMGCNVIAVKELECGYSIGIVKKIENAK